jgi:16S rRNA (cytidine1402-2'-O)-methyltransferase
LLNHYEIKKELISINAFNEKNRIPMVISRLKEGQVCALISDAGTPGISDPGTRLISAAIKDDIKIIPIPGATAVISALTISGMPSDAFVFEGFLPQKKGRQKLLKQLAEEERTIILYESVYRIKKLLDELSSYMPDRWIVICRELTKKFEETWRGYPPQLLSEFDDKINKGEFVVVISPRKWHQSSES